MDYSPETRCCPRCREKPFLGHFAAAFDYVGPAATLVKKLKYSNQPYLAQGIAAYLVAQFLELHWPMPDLIIPVPLTFTHWINRGYNQSQLLAEEVAKILNRPIQAAIIRESGDFSQAGLSRQQRLALTGESFRLRKHQNLSDKTLLLIDDVMTTGSTLNKCAEALVEQCPTAIYGLTVCRAIK
jgi:competence protein ComFC